MGDSHDSYAPRHRADGPLDETPDCHCRAIGSLDLHQSECPWRIARAALRGLQVPQ